MPLLSCEPRGYEFLILNSGVDRIIKADKNKAKAYFSTACDGGHNLGCIDLALLFCVEDKSKAVKFYKKACELGDDHGCIAIEIPDFFCPEILLQD